MGKKQGKRKSKPKSRKDIDREESLSDLDDSIDQFHKQREKISLDKNEDNGETDSDELQEDEIIGLDGVDDSDSENEEDEEDDDDDEASLRAKFLEDDDEDGDEDDESALKEGWGKKKHLYYAGDKEYSDEEAQALEEQEVLKRQKIQASQLTEDDFGLNDQDLASQKTLGERVKDKKLQGKGATDLDAEYTDKWEVEEVRKDISSLSTQQRLAIVKRESPELLKLIQEFKDNISQWKDVISPTLSSIEKQLDLMTPASQRLIQVKYHLLLTYCINICYYLLQKNEDGSSVKDHPVIEQLLNIRKISEKFQPLEDLVQELVDTVKEGIEVPTIAAPKRKETKKKPAEKKEKAKHTKIQETVEDTKPKKKVEKKTLPISKEEEGYIAQLARGMAKEKKKMKKASKAKLGPMSDFGDVLDDDEDAKDRTHKVRKLLGTLGNTQSKKTMGDADVPRKDPDEIRVPKRKMDDDDEDDEEEEERGPISEEVNDDSEDEYYVMAKQAAKAKKQKIDMQSVEDEQEEDEEEVEPGKRKASKQMLSNRGLTRVRPKDTKNPKKKFRNKYEKALKKRRGQVVKMRTPNAVYGGESVGINKNVVRSISLKV